MLGSIFTCAQNIPQEMSRVNRFSPRAKFQALRQVDRTEKDVSICPGVNLILLDKVPKQEQIMYFSSDRRPAHTHKNLDSIPAVIMCHKLDNGTRQSALGNVNIFIFTSHETWL